FARAVGAQAAAPGNVAPLPLAGNSIVFFYCYFLVICLTWFERRGMPAERQAKSTSKGVDMRLHNGERFPTITAPRVGGGEMTIPQDLAGRWAVLLFYRGHWCPYCRQQD